MTRHSSTTFPDRTLCRCHLPQIPGLAQSLTVWLGHATLPQGPWGRRLPSDRAEPSTQQAESADVRPRERGRFTAARGPVAKAALAGGGQSLLLLLTAVALGAGSEPWVRATRRQNHASREH